ncbi:MAG: PqqD family protein [Bacteroidaceae bacterium]|nr:PqqD family protein [Bacteroidaceae bacterium]
MKINRKFVLHDIKQEHFIICTDDKDININRIITLDDISAEVWNEVANKNFTVEDIVTYLLGNYDVDETTATNDAKALIEDWTNKDFIKQ